MNLDFLVKRGRLPWCPGPMAVDVDVWHEYEIPLIGTFRVNDDLVIFTQVLESPHDLSVWAYACVDLADNDVTFDSVEELRRFVEDRFMGREAVLALAKDGRIGDHWTRIDVTEGLVAAVETFLNGVISSVADPERRVRAKLAGLEAAESELAQV